MKKLFVTLLLVVTILTNIVPISVNSVNAAVSKEVVNEFTNKTPKVQATKRTAGSVTLSISSVSNAQGYKIYRSSTQTGTYEYIGITRTRSYKDTTVSYNREYYYKVRGYMSTGDENVHSKYSNTIYVAKSFARPSNMSASSLKTGDIELQWSKVPQALTYKVYRASSKTGTYRYIGYTWDTSYIDGNVDDNVTYYYKVRGYKKSAGVKYNGAFTKSIGVTSKVSNTSTAEPSTNVHNTEFNQAYANEVLVLVNQEREKAGLSKLSMSTILTGPANRRAKEIKEVFSHTRPDGSEWHTVLDEFNVQVRYGGENLAYGYNTAKSVVTGWMNSPGHKANILGANFNEIGIGVYVDNSGTVFATQIFSD